MLIEQAIFTSARTSQGSGYHLVAKSSGITPEEAAELATWGPSHGSLCDEGLDAVSVNSNYLSSGQVCISKTIASGEEYSERGGARIYTHFLIVPDEVFSRFANQPFAVLKAAWAKGLLDVPERPPTSLRPFTLAGRVPRVDDGLLAEFAEELGPQRVAQLITVAMSPGIQVITGIERSELTFAGLLNCLPVECRREVTFTTGLRFSLRRPFRLLPLEADQEEQRRVSRQEGVTVVNLDKGLDLQSAGWAKYVAELIEADHLTSLANQLQISRPSLTMEHLNELGEGLLREFRNSPRTAKISTASTSFTFNQRDTPLEKRSLSSNTSEHLIEPIHKNSVVSASTVAAPTLVDLSATSDPAAIDLVEQLDDAVFDAISGVPQARELAESLWVKLTVRLPEPTVAKLREQYLRYTLSLWEACLDDGVREPEKAAGALDVLSLLFEGD